MQRRFLAPLACAAGIPAQLGFADVKNHLAIEKLIAQLGSGTFIFHGFVEFWVHDSWVKANPAFNFEMCDRFGVHPRQFHGYHDTLFHELFFDGQREATPTLFLDEIISSFEKMYGKGYYVRP